ncbi:hypothetical protein QBC42DRAFT_287218 [Cladorrhinum samala]|uniref:Uncharacterized protein n=1 Tax=Cladorrhinum samala TaxID=585594 RepID=A0AAV9HLM1_9PEZI|nr:hypothetical protein QBC42DRAFT_287218 [Cladorrhinum samala]
MIDLGVAGICPSSGMAQATRMASRAVFISTRSSIGDRRPASSRRLRSEQDLMGIRHGRLGGGSFQQPLGERRASEAGDAGAEDFWAPFEARRARRDPVACRARRWARVDSQRPARTEELVALAPFMPDPGTNAYNLREVNNPRIRPDFWETERAHLVRARFGQETVFVPRRHLTEDRYRFGPCGVVTLANQMWVSMARCWETDARYVAGALGKLILEFIWNCLEYGDHDEVGTFYPQLTDNRLQHDKRRRHFHRRLFVRSLKYHGVNEARRIAQLSQKEVDQAWLCKMVDVKDRVDGKTFDELLRSKGPVEEWNEERSRFLELDPEDTDEEEEEREKDEREEEGDEDENEEEDAQEEEDG